MDACALIGFEDHKIEVVFLNTVIQYAICSVVVMDHCINLQSRNVIFSLLGYDTNLNRKDK